MANKRIFYAVHQVGVAEIGSQSFTPIHGLQSVGITTNFNLEQVFELGQIAIYENIENIPDIETTLEKVLDGYPLIYHLMTRGATSPTLAGRSVPQCIIGLSIFPDVQDASSGNPISQVQMSGMVVSSLTYTFPTEGNATEQVTAVGNNKVWRTSAPWQFTGAFDNTDQPFSITGSGGVQRREDILFIPADNETTLDVNGQVDSSTATILPREVDGISSSGTNEYIGGEYGAHIQQISVSTNLGREQIFELGRKAPYFRFVSFPIEVTCEIQTLSVSGDLISATEEGGQNGAPVGSNLRNNTIKIKTREGTFLNLGTKNKLSNVSYSGGEAGGGNVTITYSYTNFNDLTVTHPQDPSGL